MSIVESDGPPSWSLDVSETGESTKCLWVGVMGLKAWGEGVEKNIFFLACRALHHPYPRAFCTLPSIARIKRPRWRLVGLNDRHLRPNGKIGDCEQSSDISGSIDHYLGGSRRGEAMHPCGILRGLLDISWNGEVWSGP